MRLNRHVEKKRLNRSLEKKLSALTVTHQDAMKWFERRREGYDRLITAVCPYVSNDAMMPSSLMLERISVISPCFLLNV
jgi:hypothetical protein